jgi:hypothetical protein
MNMPGFTAEESVYKTDEPYYKSIDDFSTSDQQVQSSDWSNVVCYCPEKYGRCHCGREDAIIGTSYSIGVVYRQWAINNATVLRVY